MKIYGDYHTHTKASDGHGSVSENVAAAKELGLKELAITDHGFKSIIFHLTEEKYAAQDAEIAAENAKGEIKVLHGVEGSIISPDGTVDVPDGIIRRSDVFNLGFHRLLQANVWRGAAKYIFINGFMPRHTREKLRAVNTAAYEKAIKTYPVDTLVHLNNRALVDTARICRLAKEYGVYVELNVKHLNAMQENVAAVLDSGVNLIIGSDAHKPASVGRLEEVAEFIKRNGIPEERVFGLTKPPVFKDKSNWQGTGKEI